MVDQFHSVEIFLPEPGKHYLFKLRDISDGGMCIYIKNDSLILKYINIGDEMMITFRAPKKAPESLKVQIKHMFECGNGPFHGHYVIGLSICE
jgi:hypothetical protein